MIVQDTDKARFLTRHAYNTKYLTNAKFKQNPNETVLNRLKGTPCDVYAKWLESSNAGVLDMYRRCFGRVQGKARDCIIVEWVSTRIQINQVHLDLVEAIISKKERNFLHLKVPWRWNYLLCSRI